MSGLRIDHMSGWQKLELYLERYMALSWLIALSIFMYVGYVLAGSFLFGFLVGIVAMSFWTVHRLSDDFHAVEEYRDDWQ